MKKKNAIKASIPKVESRMVKLDKEKSLLLRPSAASDLPKAHSDMQLQAGIDEISLLNEVLDTVDEGDSDIRGIDERTTLDRWLLSFQDQEHKFASSVLICEMKYKELLQVCCALKIKIIGGKRGECCRMYRSVLASEYPTKYELRGAANLCFV